jgi:dienelactone hydrolase
MTLRRRGLVLWLCALAWVLTCVGPAWAQAPAVVSLPMARDLHEEVHQVNVQVQDMYGRREQRTIPVTLYRPAGSGPFPLLVLNHGRAGTPADRAQPQRFRFEVQARYFVGKGFAVAVPTRVGYGEALKDDFDPEFNGGCSNPRIEPMSRAASDQVLAVVAHAKRWPRVDVSRWWVAGQSVGGLTSVATVMRAPHGLQGGINFSGGTGGNPRGRPGHPCGVPQIADAWRAGAARAQVPMLWVYWENDQYWGVENPRLWHQAYVQGGGRAQLQQLDPIEGDGHHGFTHDMDHWIPVVDRFLAEQGIAKSALPESLVPSGFAQVNDVESVPISTAQRRDLYARFLASPLPRAFAIGPSGHVGFARGDWAVGRALGFCQARSGVTCRVYAVDDQVVWTP